MYLDLIKIHSLLNPPNVTLYTYIITIEKCIRLKKISIIIFYFCLQKDEVYLNLVLEYIPETVYKVARHYSKDEQTIPISFIKVRKMNQREKLG